jgi:hypothetical protein
MAGGLVAELAVPLEHRHDALVVVAGIIGSIVDDEFRSHCRIGVVTDDCVVIHVDSAAYVMPLRARWSATAVAALKANREFSRIKQVRFEFGCDGATLRS